MKNEMLMIWFGWPKVVTGDCLHFRVPFYEVYQCLISETDVESFALEGRDSVAEVSFQYEIDCSARVLENVIVKNYVACLYVVAFYSGPHSCSLCTHVAMRPKPPGFLCNKRAHFPTGWTIFSICS